MELNRQANYRKEVARLRAEEIADCRENEAF